MPEKWRVKEPAEVAVRNGVNKKSEISSKKKLHIIQPTLVKICTLTKSLRVVFSSCCVVGYYLRVPKSPLPLLDVSYRMWPVQETFQNTVKFQVSFRMVNQPSQLQEKTKQNKTKTRRLHTTPNIINNRVLTKSPNTLFKHNLTGPPMGSAKEHTHKLKPQI